MNGTCNCSRCVTARASSRRYYLKHTKLVKARNNKYKQRERAKMKSERVSDEELDRRALAMGL